MKNKVYMKQQRFGHAPKDRYGNISLKAPDGELLGYISKRKARYYERNGSTISYDAITGAITSVRLNFEPKYRTRSETLLQVLETRCVVCGIEHGLSLHHVIPYRVKRTFPLQAKDNTHFWCVMLCDDHHHRAEILLDEVCSNISLHKATINALGDLYETFRAIKSLYVIREYHSEKIPADKITLLLDKAGIKTLDDVPQEDELNELESIWDHLYLSTRNKIILQWIEEQGGIDAVKQIFRDTFMKLDPKFLPSGFLELDSTSAE